MKTASLMMERFSSRPGSNPPFFAEVLEKVVVTQLVDHLRISHLRCSSQIVDHHSTETALV